VLPGDTVWLRGGTYRGTFISELRGTATAPIVVRPVEGEHARVDSGSTGVAVPTLYVKGAWTTYQGFEVMSSEPTRLLTESGSQPAALKRGVGIDVHGPNTKFVNLIVHDLADGIGIWADAENSEAYGNIVYFNGWEASDRAHGHGVYTQNRAGSVRRIAENLIFDQFSHGIHAYGSDAADLDDIQLTGNVVFNNGALDPRYYDRNILLGGQRKAANPVVEHNFTYYSARVRHGGENNIGYNAGCTNLVARDNYFAGQVDGGAPLVLSRGCAGEVTGNTFIGPIEPWIGQAFPANSYTQAATGLHVFVRPNEYDRRRFHVVVFNWDRLPTIDLDLSAARLDRRARFELRDAQNIFGEPLAAGVFGSGRVTIALRGLATAAPVGNVPAPAHTAPEFLALVLTGAPDSSSNERMAGAVARGWQWARNLFASPRS
jgi:hypothetical protein